MIKKHTKKTGHKGGGQMLTVSMTVKYPFFFDDFPQDKSKNDLTRVRYRIGKGQDILRTKNEFGYGGLPPPPSLFTAEIDKVAFYNPPSSSNQFVSFLVLHSGKLSPSPPVPPTH